MDQIPWLLLLYRLPTKRNTERVAVWRRFKKIGALQLTTSTYLIPDQSTQHEHFQWLAKLIRDSGGEATLIRVREIEGLSNEKLIEMFNDARDKEYAALRKALRALEWSKKAGANEGDELDRLTRQFRAIRGTDFFESTRGQEIEIRLRKIEETRQAKGALPKIDPANYRGRTWLTRPRPEIDRVGSAWLIRKFIDPEAQFRFARHISAEQGAVAFDMLNAEFSHVGEDCTFETLTKRFVIGDKAVQKIGEMIHDADLEDDKFQRVECVGIDRILKGCAKEGLPDEEILRRGFECFDALYSFLQRR
jgi:hypothetical protein